MRSHGKLNTLYLHRIHIHTKLGKPQDSLITFDYENLFLHFHETHENET